MRGLDVTIEIKTKSETLTGKTVFITGGTKGTGKEIALRLAKDGANIVFATKIDKSNSKLSVVHTAIQEVEAAGGRGLAVPVDIRNEAEIKNAAETAVRKFGGIDVLINNASIISLTDTEDTDIKEYDLINNVNARGTFLVTKSCLPYLKKSSTPHVLNISPPINLKRQWIAGRVGYALAKYGMSMCVIGMAEEFRGYGISVNALWPRTIIENDALAAKYAKEVCRKPQIMADAAYSILTRNPRPIGEFFLDDQALSEVGVTDFEQYAVDPAFINQLVLNAFVDDSGAAYQKKTQKQTVDIQKSETSAQMMKIIEAVESLFDTKLVEKVQTVFQIIVTGEETKKLYIDLKSGFGAFKFGAPPQKPDIIITMDESSFFDTFVKGIRPSFAFTNGKLKVEGDSKKVTLLDEIVRNYRAKL